MLEQIGTNWGDPGASARASSKNGDQSTLDLLKTLLNSIPDMVFYKDLGGRFLGCNPAFARFVLRTADEVIGKTSFDFFESSGAEDYSRSDALVIETGEPSQAEIWMESPAGKRVLLDTIKAPLWRDGRIIGILGICRDITRRRKAEDALRNNEAMLQMLFQEAPVGLTLSDSLGNFLKVNPALQKMLGMSEEELLLQNYRAVTAPGFESLERAEADEFRRTGAYGPLEKELLNREGSAIPVRIQGTQVIGSDGQEAIWSIVEDIGAQQRSERLLSAVADAGKLLLTHDNIETAVSEVLATLGIAASADRCFVMRFHPLPSASGLGVSEWLQWEIDSCKVEFDSAITKNIPVVEAGFGPVHTELVKGASVTILTSQVEGQAKRILEAQGIQSVLLEPILVHDEIWGIIGFDECHAERVWTDGESGMLRSVSSSIGLAVEQSLGRESLKEANRRLEEALKEAESANRAKSEFLANMSHEIRTPLNGIQGIAELLGGTPLTTQQSEYIRLIESSGNNLLKIINEILDFSKIEAGRVVLESHEFDLEELVRDIASLFHVQARNKGLILRCELPEQRLPLMVGDPVRLRQIITNLVSNAVKFTHQGEVACTVTCENISADNLALRIQVRDTGVGIPLDKQVEVFESFTQADPSTTRVYGGTGLGLAISKRLANLMGGEIGLLSEPGCGSSFWVDVSLLRATEQAETVPAVVPDVDFTNMRVLLVEDNQVNVLVATAHLESMGCSVTVASDGLEAVSLAGSQPFHVILMDLQMPRMDGLDATRRIRYLEAALGRPRVPIIAMTSSARLEDRQLCLEAGMDEHVAKPVHWKELAKALSSFALAKAA
jgi:PAS domain S-box-containing protein